MAHFGHYLCLLGLVFSLYSVVASSLAIATKRFSWHHVSRRSMLLSNMSIILAVAVLWTLFFQRDYSVEYIYKNSSNDLPIFYTITALWSSLEGSHLFWSLILSVVSVVSLARIKKELLPLQGYLRLFFSAVMV